MITRSTQSTNDSVDLPLFSIGIPTFNRLAYLRRAIQVALQQSYPNLQVVVSDNASSDGTDRFVEGLGDSRIKYVRSSVNKGAQENFKNALYNADGEFFSWLQDDDIIFSHFVKNAVKALVLSDADIYMSSSSMSNSITQLRDSMIYSPFVNMDWASGLHVEFERNAILGLSFYVSVCNPPVVAFRKKVLLENHKTLSSNSTFPLFVERAIICDVVNSGKAIASPNLEGIYFQHDGQYSKEIVSQSDAERSQFKLFADYLETIATRDEIRESIQLRHILESLPIEMLRRFHTTSFKWTNKSGAAFEVKKLVDEIFSRRFQDLERGESNRSVIRRIAKNVFPPFCVSLYQRYLAKSV
jgi:hypothetical protein